MLNSTTVLPSSYYRSSAPLNPPPSHLFLGRPQSNSPTEENGGGTKRKALHPPAQPHRALHPPAHLGIPTPAPIHSRRKVEFTPTQAANRITSSNPTEQQPRPANPSPASTPTPSSSAPPPPAPTPLAPTPSNLHGPTYKRPAFRPPNASELPTPERTLHLPPPSEDKRRKVKWEFASPPQLPTPALLRVDGMETRSLPPLPPLREELFRTVFTHTSYACMKKQPFEEPEGNPMVDYERLEHLGDAVLGAAITEMIMSIFPKITPGAASILKANLVNNKNALSSISACYHLHTKLRATPAQIYSLKLQTSVRAELFEAYLAAVFKQYGYSMAKLWVNDLFAPIAIAGYEALMMSSASLRQFASSRQPELLSVPASSSNKLRFEQAKLNPSAEGENCNIGFAALLNQWCLQNKRTLEYLEGTEESSEKLKLYAFKLFVEKEGVRQQDGSVPESGWHEFGPFYGNQKKVIKNNLASLACHSLGIVAEIE